MKVYIIERSKLKGKKFDDDEIMKIYNNGGLIYDLDFFEKEVNRGNFKLGTDWHIRFVNQADGSTPELKKEKALHILFGYDSLPYYNQGKIIEAIKREKLETVNYDILKTNSLDTFEKYACDWNYWAVITEQEYKEIARVSMEVFGKEPLEVDSLVSVAKQISNP